MKIPNKEEIQAIYYTMHKLTEEDILNCNSCGYWSCEGMAVAIFNGLSKKENCHFYLQKELARNSNFLEEGINAINDRIDRLS